MNDFINCIIYKNVPIDLITNQINNYLSLYSAFSIAMFLNIQILYYVQRNGF